MLYLSYNQKKTHSIHYLLSVFLLLTCIAGCFDTVRPSAGVAGEIIGCVEEETGLICAVRYPLEATQEVPPVAEGVYLCTIADVEDVYDGDTITDVHILVSAVDFSSIEQLGEVFPNIVLKENGIYVQNSIRITGIDTPEIRVSTKKADGTPRSDVSRANEKKAAIAARDAVRRLFEDNGLLFTISEVEHDKFGRVLGVVTVGDVNVAEYLIEKGHALPYDGGTKEELDWDNLDEGLVF